MKNIKILALVAAVICTVGSVAGCGQKESGKSEDGTMKITYATSASAGNETELIEDKYSPIIKDKFGIEIEYDKIPSSNWSEKMNLLFASGEEPDVIGGGKEGTYKAWAAKGYLKAIDPEAAGMENYLALFDNRPWENVLEYVKSPDGKLYFLPSVRPGKAGGSWIYRKDLFDKAGITEFPTTTEEFYQTLKKLKETYPDKVIMSSTGKGDIYALGFFYQMFWLPDLLFQENAIVDPLTKEFIPYAFADDRCRDMMIFLNKLYTEGLIDKEILSLTSERYNQKITNGSVLIQFASVSALDRNNERSKLTDPNANWVYADKMITNYPEKGFIYKKMPLYFDAGVCFSANIEDEKLEKMLKYFDWGATEEGRKILTFGFEGDTYHMEDGKMRKNEDVYDLTYNPDGTLFLEQYGVPGIMHNAPHQDYLDLNPVSEEEKKIEEFYLSEPNYYGFDQIIMNYTEEENKRRVDLETAVNEVRDKELTAFLMGMKDPKDDAQWEAYLDELDRVGLQELNKIKTDAYNRGKQ